MNKAPSLVLAPACHFEGNVLAPAKFLMGCVPFEMRGSRLFHTAVLLMPSAATRVSSMSMLQECCAVMASRCGIKGSVLHVIVREKVA
jgi:hypothetical protein